jgi:hypothetical protein
MDDELKRAIFWSSSLDEVPDLRSAGGRLNCTGIPYEFL